MVFGSWCASDHGTVVAENADDEIHLLAIN
jgi:hypothetical protein